MLNMLDSKILTFLAVRTVAEGGPATASPSPEGGDDTNTATTTTSTSTDGCSTWAKHNTKTITGEGGEQGC